MFAVIFEVQPKADRWDQYLDLAKYLKPELEKVDGFIDNERFASQRTQGRILSLSTWRDEKAVVRWRTLGMHHDVQEKGRFEVFEDYHLRVGEITSDTRIPAGQQMHEQRFDETEVGAAKYVTISEFLPVDDARPSESVLPRIPGSPTTETGGLVDQELFESIYNPGKVLLLLSWRDAVSAGHWMLPAVDGVDLRHRHVRVIRDYGMFDRREAPQYYPPVLGARQ
jgi:heme-degrading monooxygenase HmoA